MLSRHALRQLMGQASGAGSLEAVYDTALRCVQEGLSVERASLLVFDATRTMRFVAWSGLSDEYRAAVDGHSPWSPDDSGATPLLVPDVEHDASLAPYLPVFRREGIRALAFIPLQFGSRLLGKFMLYYRGPHTFPDGEIVTAQQIADHVAFALEHHRLAVALEGRLVVERELRHQAETEAAQRTASESRLHLALASCRMGAWDWDIASGRVGWSAELESIHGLEPGTFGGTFDAFRRDVHPADLKRLEAAISAAIEAPEADYDVDYRIVRGDGACRWLSGKGRVLVDSEGRPTRMIGICRDVTEHREAEEARALLAGQLEALAQITGQIAIAFDPDEALQQLASSIVPTFADYCITYIANDQAIQPLGFAHRDAAKSALVAALTGSGRVTVEDQWGPGMVIREGEPWVAAECDAAQAEAVAPDAAHQAAHRALAPRSMMIVPLNARGRTLGAITFATTDDSGRRFGQEDLKLAMELAGRAALLVDNARLYAEARSAIRARDDMIAVVSHDLRDPLQSISAAAATLRLEPEGGERTESIQTILLASTQLRLLVQDLLDISLIDAGHLTISFQRVDLTTLLKEAHTLFLPQAEGKDVRLELQVADDLPPVAADRRRVLQVLLNLIGNSLKFVPAGGVITLGAKRQGGEVGVWVADTGAGIAPDDLARVFDRFWRADRHEGGGVGLGLAVAKGIVEAHGGRIGVDSRPGAGSTFTFTLSVDASPEPQRVMHVVAADGPATALIAKGRLVPSLTPRRLRDH
jgi:PAS domain S-box-containing protein